VNPLHGPGFEEWREHLRAAASALREEGIPVPPLEGKLLRPGVAWALGAEGPGVLDDGAFAMGALAVQMVHEASLLHDDILDEAETRRGRVSLAAERGPGYALVLGDAYLTGAYRAAARVGHAAFLGLFIEAVERTVAGEAAQARLTGRIIDEATYLEVIRGKSGELFGAAAAIAALHRGMREGEVARARELGRDVGALYQRIDDFLDYCPRAETGKTPFQDYGQRKFTFVLREAEILDFEAPPEAVCRALFSGGSESPMNRALRRIRSVRDDVLQRARALFGPVPALEAILDGWVLEGEEALGAHAHLAPDARVATRETVTNRTGVPGDVGGMDGARDRVVAEARAVGGPGDWGRYFGHHSKSFRFASRLFPAEPRADVEGVYAFCRFTDDLVDEAGVPATMARERLEAWREMVRAAYDGDTTGVPLADVVMSRSAQAAVPFHYIESLLDGVAMDLEPTDYGTLEELETYTYRVASVVGGWITELFGLHDPRLLQRAYSLGHAMQLTNILRDVGEDWRRGRLYLPQDRLDAHGIDREGLDALARRGEVPGGYPELMEELIGVADRHYALAFEAIPCLPSYYRRPVAVAARVYQGIHDEIRRNDYDNGSRRAHTSLRRKLRLGWSGLRDLRDQHPAPSLTEEALLGLLAAGDGSTPSSLRGT
jgi:phytoene synthase